MSSEPTRLGRSNRSRTWNSRRTAVLSLLAVPIPLLLSPVAVLAQSGEITGMVRSAEKKVALESANVWVVGTNLSGATAEDGSFTLGQVPAGQWLLKVNLMGFAEATVAVNVKDGKPSVLEIFLTGAPVALEGITVSGSRRLEKVTDAPVSLSLVTGEELGRTTALHYAESLQGVRGVDTYRGGVDAVVANARGFTTAYNYRLRVLVDNRNGHLPALGIPAGVFYPVVEEDIDRMEVILGPSSALYGPNAHNGLLHILTKHPQDYPGTTLVTGGGGNSVFFTRVRHAGAHQRLAYKFNAEYFTGTEWTKNDTVAVDDFGRAYLDIAGEELKRVRANGSFYLFPSPETQVVTSFGVVKASSPFTMNTGRGYAVDSRVDFQEIRLETPRFFAHAYRIGNDVGDTHAIEAKVAAMVAAANEGSTISESEAIAQARTIEKGYRLNYEMQYRDRFVFGNIDFTVIAGVQHEDMRPNTEGTLFTEGRVEPSDPVTENLRLRQTGFYGQLEADLNDRWRLVLAGRRDTHSKYEAQTSPRVGVVYRSPGKGSLRVTYNRAFQAPEIIQLALLREAGSVPGTSIPVVVRGNGDGFTLSDGTDIPPLSPERNSTVEFGYKGFLGDRLFLDANLYRSRYENFLSPLVPITDPANGVYPIALGEHPLAPFPSQFVLTYRNFGRVNLNGLDLGLTYRFNDQTSAWLNYSHMHLVDLEDPANDFNGDGEYEELSLNAPENKASFGVAVTELLTNGLYGAVSGRWVEKYDFIAGSHRATEFGKGTGSFQFKDRGPLGGFLPLDVHLSYALSARVQLGLSVTNVLDEGLREMVGSPEIGRLFRTEVKYNLR